ncbi:MAG: FAD/NAD(P)-binding protein [Crocinitomicaceae bacterium]|nr:NAD(P)/FAD-dependent oxidoreductase [Crocinitomicaceae bacterium]
MKIAFIGSGPVSLLKAYLHAKGNPNDEIIIIDQHNRVGGAWYSDISTSGHEIECGCHIWSYCPEVYDFFKKEFELQLQPFNPNAVFVGKHFNLPYSLKNTINTYTFIAKNTLTGKFSRNKEVRTEPMWHTRIFGKKNQYPLKGSVELINSMKRKLDALSNVEFLLGKQVDAIDVMTKVTLAFREGEKLEVDKAILTSVSEIKEVNSASKKIELVQDRRDYIHLLLSSNQSFRKKISYWRLMNDNVIHRISDISYQTENKENLLLVGIKPDPFYSKSEDELTEYCRHFLLNKGVIVQNQSLDRIKTHVFPTYYIKEGLRNQINNIDLQKIELIHSTDLIYGFFRILKKENLI